MHTVPEAWAAILAEVRPFEPQRLPLLDALGLALAEDAAADADCPPFDKSLMDGFAVRAADVAEGGAQLKMIEEVPAGHVPSRPVGPGEATHLMTGAPLPEGADAVVPIEHVAFDEAARVMTMRAGSEVGWASPTSAPPSAGSSGLVGTGHPTSDAGHSPKERKVAPGANVLRRGTVYRQGERVLSAGTVLRPQELGVLAELGYATVLVRRRPRVAVLATGDELVPVDRVPGPGRIRNSNETMLAAQVRRWGAEPVLLGIARDEPEHLRARILAGLECDVLLLSGGVSAGKKDLVPGELEKAGVRQVFHKVSVKPGKPLWFGVLQVTGDELRAKRESTRRSLLVTRHSVVFGLPGNPVSSLVCCELFVRPALRRLMGLEPALPQPFQARLAEDHVARGGRPTYHPARLDWTESGPVVRMVAWQGSSDLRGTLAADALAIIPPGDRTWKAGETIEELPL